MLTPLTYTPTSGAEAAILPCLPDHLRRQVLAEQARLLEMARSIEKASPAEAGQSQVGLGGSRQRGSVGRHCLPPFERENLAIGRLVAKQGRHPVSSCQVAAVVDNSTRE